MSKSLQHKLDRVRRPRVQITYDVETLGAPEKIELPFVVGVLADLSGQPAEPLPHLRDRKFVYIDRDNFNGVLEKSAPRLALKVANRLTGDEGTKLSAELNFRHIDDFEPPRVAEQIEPLRELLEIRRRLAQLLSKMEGKFKAEELIEEVLRNTERRQALAQELGLETQTTTPQEESQ